MPLVGRLVHMAVTRLRSRRDAREQLGLEALRDMLCEAAEAGAPRDTVGRLVAAVERELASRRGWGFIMVEPRLYAEVVAYLTRHSRRPLKAVELWARLFSVLPPTVTRSRSIARSWPAWSASRRATCRRSWVSWRPWAPSTAAGRAVASGTSSTPCSAPTWPTLPVKG